MPVDPYAMCPCGSGKKLKFCCSDLVGEIEKIHRMIEGEQPRAALRHVEQTLATHPGRASLLDLKATLEMSLGDLDAARQTVTQFVAENRDSATAHACEAILLAEDDKPRDGRRFVAAALGAGRARNAAARVRGIGRGWRSAVGSRAHPGRSGPSLVTRGTRTEGRHAFARSAGGAQSLFGLAADLARSVAVSPLARQRALESRSRKGDAAGRQRQVARSRRNDRSVGTQARADPTLLFNRALLGGWLADDRALVAGLHAFAQLDVPLDDAVEAEAIAQMLDPDLKEKRLDSTIQSFAIGDLDAPGRRGSQRTSACNRSKWTRKCLPGAISRGRGIRLCSSIGRCRRSGVGFTRDDVPRLCGILAIYGRQTDRPERLEFSIEKGPGFEPSIATLKEIAGDALGELLEEKVIGSVSPTDQAINWRWHLPRDTPPAVRRQLIEDERRTAIVERWPKLPQPSLRGKTALDAADDPELRIPLAGQCADPRARRQHRSRHRFDCRTAAKIEAAAAGNDRAQWSTHQRAAACADLAAQICKRYRTTIW